MSATANNAGFVFGGEFVCAAIPAPGIPLRESQSRFVNEGFSLDGRKVAIDMSLALHVPREDFAGRSTDQLIALVREFGGGLGPQTLCDIHAVALQRFVEAKEPDPTQAKEVLLLVAQAFAIQLESRDGDADSTRSTRDEF